MKEKRNGSGMIRKYHSVFCVYIKGQELLYNLQEYQNGKDNACSTVQVSKPTCNF